MSNVLHYDIAMAVLSLSSTIILQDHHCIYSWSLTENIIMWFMTLCVCGMCTPSTFLTKAYYT